LDAKIN